MRTMRHVRTIRTTTILAACAALCSSAPLRAGNGGEKLQVVTTLNVLADIAREVGGERVEVESLSDPRQDPHYVEPRPTLMRRAHEADVFIEIGLQLELWADKVAQGSGNTKIQAGQPGRIIASTGIATLELPTSLSREWGDVHPYGNPHVWLDPLNAVQVAENIAKGFAAVDPEHAADYSSGAERFRERIDRALFGADLVTEMGADKLERLARQGRLADYLKLKDLEGKLGGWLKLAAPLQGKAIVTYHKTMAYAADRFGFQIAVEIEEKPGIQPSARQRDAVVSTIRDRGLHTVLQEPYYDRAAADYLAEKTGVHVLIQPIDVGPEVGITSYFDLIDGLLRALVGSESP